MRLIKIAQKYFSASVNTVWVFLMLIGIASCNNSSSTTTLPGVWDKMSPFSGYPRSGAVSFVINNVAYVGGGFNYDALNQGVSSTGRFNDFFKFDGERWTKVTPFPGTARSQATAFTIGNKAYVGLGTDGTYDLSDFWEYDPNGAVGGTWTQIADFGTNSDPSNIKSPRHGAIAFTVSNRGFVGGGHYLGELNDLWEYLPATDEWKQGPDIGGDKRQNAFVMVINDIAYVGGGVGSGNYVKDFFKFDISLLNSDGSGQPWIRLNGLTGKDANGNAIAQPRPRESASTFTIDGYGYVMCGNPGPASDIWQYDPSKDLWTQYFSFQNNVPDAGAPRSAAVAFALLYKGVTYGFLTTGGTTSTIKYDDCWRFDPTKNEPDNL